MKSNYVLTGLISLVSIATIAQQKCDQLNGYDLCKISDLKHILTVKPVIFTDALTYGVDSEKLAEWNKVVSAIGSYIGKNHAELNNEYLQLRSIADGLANTVKIVKNATNRVDKEKVVRAYFDNRELFKQSPEDTLNTIRKKLAPGSFSRHKVTRDLLIDFAKAISEAINLVKIDGKSMGLIK
jgi:hypothetical protein